MSEYQYGIDIFYTDIITGYIKAKPSVKILQPSKATNTQVVVVYFSWGDGVLVYVLQGGLVLNL